MTDRRSRRQSSLRELLGQHGAEALLVSHLPNVRWLTGFTGSSALVLVTPRRTVLLTDFRYETQAPQEVGTAAEVVIERSNLWERLRRLITDAAPATLAIEAHVLPVRDAARLDGAVRAPAIPLAGIVEELRQVKDPQEVAAIRSAADLAQAALADVLPTIRPGDREIDVAARLEYSLRRRGSEWHPFPTILASGPRGALPHGRTSTRPLAEGDLVVIDFGAQVDGYCSDITRTVAMGRVDERQRTIYDLVHEAQRRAREGIRAAMTGREADALARDVIAARGYGEAFGHSLGHGLGLEVHEAPRLAVTADAPIPAGAVVTIEPGIYLSGWGGVRIEDDVWLGPDGPVLLTDGRTDLITLDA